MTTKQIYQNNRPQLTIRCTGGKNLGRCYEASYYEVTSRFPLDRDTLNKLNQAGLLGLGQEFLIKGQQTEEGGFDRDLPDAKTWQYQPKPTGFDIIPMVEVDDETKVVIRVVPDAELYKQPYYVYSIESRVDSSD